MLELSRINAFNRFRATPGQVKLVAVASSERLPKFPDLPTVAETIPGFTASGWQVLQTCASIPESAYRCGGAGLACGVS
jgi:hypothetical protein